VELTHITGYGSVNAQTFWLNFHNRIAINALLERRHAQQAQEIKGRYKGALALKASIEQ
jgi:hypothetical protein